MLLKWNTAGQVTRLAGDPLQAAAWLQACHDVGIAARVQINESARPEEGTRNVTAPADQTGAWYRQLDAALQAEGINGLNEEIRQAALADLLARTGFIAGQVQELQWHRIRWPQMSQEEADRRELNSLLDEQEQCQLYCNRE
ncbi:hypothetical protein NUKP24_39890 [Klebsiella variicola]|nr:hypothetical protein A593_26020 [Klebsiella variicola]GKJ35473.1 hypothetical protein NUKP24_39890 [Klebsiella variicola]GKN72500.1 hypothetical protein NUKP86_45900 [Klebsiella variicola]